MSGTEAVMREASRHPILVAVAAGLIAGAVSGRTDKFFDRFVSPQQKRRDRRVREGSAHEVAGPYLASKILGKKLNKRQKKIASAIFAVTYGAAWGVIHSRLRRKFPTLTKWGGLPFAIPFFFACDGLIAPTIGVTPNLRRVPWQPSVKEMGNHIAWTAAAEMIHRASARARL